MQHPMLMGSLVVGGVATLMCLVAMATTGWATGTYRTDDIAIGLFNVCVKKCAAYSATGSVATTKAFVVIGWLCSLGALITSLVYFFKFAKNDVANRNLPLIAAVFYFIAAGTVLLAAIIFGSAGVSSLEKELARSSLSPGYSFALAIIGALIAGAAGALMIVHRGRIGGAAA